MSPEARVGLATLLAFVVLVVTVLFLRGGDLLRPPGYDLTVLFDNAAGVDIGTALRMSGVTVGKVKAVTLAPTNQARVTVTVRSGVRIPEGSSFLVATTGLVGDRFISITPGPPENPVILPGTEVRGVDPVTVEALAKRFEGVADRVEQLLGSLDTLVSDPEMRENLRQALRNARDATAIARQAAANVERTTARFQRLVDTDAAALAQNLREMSQTLVETADRLRTFIETATGDGVLARDLRETAASMREASERIKRMAADLQGLINPEKVGKAREIVDDAREAVREARTVVQRANTFMERVDRLLPSDLRLPNPRSLLRLDYEVWYAGQRAGHGIDLSLFPEAARFYRVGIHDIGGRNTIVLQVGQRVSAALAWRAGVFESQVGLGLDYRLLDPLLVSLDLYNLNQLTLDAITRYQLTPRWRISLGGKNLLRQPSFVFGIGTNF